MFKKLFLFVLISFSLCPVIGAAREFDIVAVVNNSVITNHELQDRITIALGSAGITDTETARAKLALQTLEQLIDEKIHKQEADRLNINISDDEMQRAISSIAAQNNYPPDQFDKFIKDNKIPKQAFIKQIEGQLIWQKMVIKTLQPKIFISKDEIDEFITRISSQKDGQELLLSEILIPVSIPEQEEDSKALSEKLVEELRNGDKKFSAFAQQFSRSNTAKQGGSVGWIPESDLESSIQNALSGVRKGEITNPIRTSVGYLIMKIEDIREGKENPETPNEDKVREFLVRKKLELDARKYMKNLRRSAYIERRI